MHYVLSPHAHAHKFEQVFYLQLLWLLDLHIQDIIMVLFLVFSTFVPQVKTVACGVAIVTQPHATLLAKPLGVCTFVMLITASAMTPLRLPWT